MGTSVQRFRIRAFCAAAALVMAGASAGVQAQAVKLVRHFFA